MAMPRRHPDAGATGPCNRERRGRGTDGDDGVRLFARHAVLVDDGEAEAAVRLRGRRPGHRCVVGRRAGEQAVLRVHERRDIRHRHGEAHGAAHVRGPSCGARPRQWTAATYRHAS